MMKTARKSWYISGSGCCLLLVAIGFLDTRIALAQGEFESSDQRSVGQVASVFEQDPEWLEWIASKNKKTTAKSSTSSWGSGSWGSWWSGSTSSKPRSPMSSYRRDNKTTYQRFSQSSKRMWSTTASWLDPYPAPKPQSSIRPAKKSWYSSWTEGWGGGTKKPTQSVSDFIGQEHPK